MSFAKIFESIYDGTLADHWQALVTFQQMLILCDAQGIVDMTPAAITRRTGIPAEIIQAGIEVLERPDPKSRSQAVAGCRICRLDSARDWGWFIVNHAEYRKKITSEEKREKDRQRIAEKRSKNNNVATCRNLSRSVADVAQAEAEAEAEAEATRAKAKEFAPPDSRATPAVCESPPAITLPLNTGEEFPITRDQVREFSDLYPAVDVMQALRSMRGWLVTNPANRKTRSGVLRFVNRWLAREQDGSRRPEEPANGTTHRGASRRISAVEQVERAIHERRERSNGPAPTLVAIGHG